MIIGEGEVAVLKFVVGIHVVTEKISGPINRTNHCRGNSCLNLTILISSGDIGQCDFYFSFKSHIDFKFWKSLRTDGYVERVWWMIWRRWINSFTVFTIHRTTKDLNKSTLWLPLRVLWGYSDATVTEGWEATTHAVAAEYPHGTLNSTATCSSHSSTA